MVEGDVRDPGTVAAVREHVGGRPAFVVEDSAHVYDTTRASLQAFSDLVPISGFFVAIGHTPNSEIFKDWLELDEVGYIKTIPGTSKTNIEGIFASGDVQDKIYRQAVTAAELIHGLDERELARIFREFGDEPQAMRFARAIVQERGRGRFETTTQLARLIEKLAPRHGSKRHPATRVFQALRMAVNDEGRSLRSGLAAACTCLRGGGRLVVITFHSLEDRVVKHTLRALQANGTLTIRTKRPQVPTEAEIERNPRARSAKLRAATR